MKRSPTTLGPARLKAARALLAKYPFGSYDIVLATLSEQFGFQVIAETLGSAFERAGLSTPQSYMAGAPIAHCESCTCRQPRKRNTK